MCWHPFFFRQNKEEKTHTHTTIFCHAKCTWLGAEVGVGGGGGSREMGGGGGGELTKVDMPLHCSPLCWDQGSAQGRAWAVFHTWVGWWAWGDRCSPPCGACFWWCLWTSQAWPPWSCRCGAGLFHTFPAHKSETVSLRLPREEHW